MYLCEGTQLCKLWNQLVLFVFCFEWYGDHRDLHRVDRRQRQMCIRDSLNAAGGHGAGGGGAYGGAGAGGGGGGGEGGLPHLSLIHISEPTRPY